MKHWNTQVLALLLGGTVAAAAACNREEAAPPAAATNPPAASPESARQTDERLTTNIQAKYYSDEIVRGRDVSVSAENGVVTLRGSVDSETAKQRAVALARDVQGVTDVRDELRVEEPARTTADARPGPAVATDETAGTAGATIQPGWITTKIQAQYFVNPEIKPWNIDVTTRSDGVVTLEGEVDGAEDKAEAVRIARATEGVTRVEDRLRVKGEARSADAPAAGTPDADRPDIWLTAKVQSKFFLDDLVKMRNINVDTQNAVVTLNGSVGSEAERRQAVALARNTEGVREVTDQLKVDPSVRDRDRASAARDTSGDTMARVPPLQRPDGWITMKIQSQFFLDPDIKGHEINVDTNKGVVRLTGSVASAEQKQEAEQIARETEGVARVVNELTIGSR